MAEAKEARFQRRVARLKAASALASTGAAVARLKAGIDEEHVKLSAALAEMRGLRKAMAAVAASGSGWAPAAVQHHFSRVMEQTPVQVRVDHARACTTHQLTLVAKHLPWMSLEALASFQPYAYVCMHAPHYFNMPF